MKMCNKCRCMGRVKQVVKKEDGEYAQYICVNPACLGYREVFSEDKLPATEPAMQIMSRYNK